MEKAKVVLNYITKHEKISRETLAFNVLQATEHLRLNENRLCCLLAQICNLNPKTVYLWIAPEWTSKFTLKALSQISVALNIPLEVFLEEGNVKEKSIRPKKRYCETSRENEVLSYIKLHPDDSAKTIALHLGLSETTVRRHMKKGDRNNE